jgi:hypothetical protein
MSGASGSAGEEAMDGRRAVAEWKPPREPEVNRSVVRKGDIQAFSIGSPARSVPPWRTRAKTPSFGMTQSPAW